jgi:dolichol-phosphate mannosyltransferase
LQPTRPASESPTSRHTVDLTVLLLTRDEAENLRTLIPGLTEILQSLRVSYEILVVDHTGGSTADVARSLGCVVIVQSGTGYGSAFREGLSGAQGEFIVTLDADHSHPPRFLRHMWACRHLAEIIVGTRYAPAGRADMPLIRTILSRLLNWTLARLLALPLSDLSSGYRLYRRSILPALFPLLGNDFDVLEEVLVKAWCTGYRIREVPIEYRPRHSGRSNARALAFALSSITTVKALWTLRNSATTCDYDTRAFSSWILPQRWWQRRRFAIVDSLLDGRGRSLDVGCGASQIIRSRPAMVGLDVNAAKLRYLRLTNPYLAQGSAFCLPFRDAAFSTLVSSEVIEHVPKSVALFAEMNRVLEPGGTLVLGTPDYASRWWRWAEYWYQLLLPNAYADEHVSHYTRAELCDLLDRSGFEVLSCSYVFRAELVVHARKRPTPTT